MPDDLIERLESTRDGYAEELNLHRFRLDAYAGTGGFAGKVPRNRGGHFGEAANIYSNSTYINNSSQETYLDEFPREGAKKFRKRVELAFCPNYAATAVDIPLSYSRRKQGMREAPPEIIKWASDDSHGISWDELLYGTIDQRSAILGYNAVLVDLPRVNGEYSKEEADALGIKPRAIPLFPANMLDWETDDFGRFVWVKTSVPFRRSGSALGGSINGTRITVWTANDAEWWEIVEIEGEKSIVHTEKASHEFGEVPIVSLPFKPLPGCGVRGLPQAGDIAFQQRRLLNVYSELTEFQRKCAFAFLQIPSNGSIEAQTATLGPANAMTVPTDSSRDLKWISPDTDIADMYFKQAEQIQKEIFRQANLEWTDAKQSSAKSGIARAYEFETANRSIASFAKQVAQFDEKVLRLVASVYPSLSGKLIKVTAHTNFAVQEIAQTLEEAIMALELGLGEKATIEIKKRVVANLLPNLSPKELAAIDTDIEDVQKNEADEVAQLEAVLTEGDNE